MTKDTETKQQVEESLEAIRVTVQANPEALTRLREEYGVTIDPTGQLVEVREPKRLKKALKRDLEEANTESKGKHVAQSISRGAAKTGEVVAYALVDVPVEGAKTARQTVKSAVRNRVQRSKEAHQRRLLNAEARKAARAMRKQERKEAESQEQAEQTA